jgi:periplasmic divalent cation tolerance protein
MTACASKKEADKILNVLLKKRLIACANMISGVGSKFWWGRKIEKAKEVIIVMKARLEKFSAIEKEIKHLHSYEVPEIIAIPIVAGSKRYLKWIEEVTIR